QPTLLREEEFLAEAGDFDFIDVDGKPQTLRLPAGSLAFTLCQVPVIYHLTGSSEPAKLALAYRDGKTVSLPELALGLDACGEIYARSGKIARIEALIPRSLLK
ncbi:MAG TPA: hypothetical protein VK465_12535, partial [Fibrobacteria bacterium]|nr:hypothetical protein [Fibrobacteria bacterium]